MLTLFSTNLTPASQSQAVQTHTIPAPKQESEIKYAQYCNARFEYCIDYPKEVIIAQPESDNGDGRIFTNKKGEENLRVYGTNNMDTDGGKISIQQQYKKDVNRIKEKNVNNDYVITYQKLGKAFFVISGYKKGKIFLSVQN